MSESGLLDFTSFTATKAANGTLTSLVAAPPYREPYQIKENNSEVLLHVEDASNTNKWHRAWYSLSGGGQLTQVEVIDSFTRAGEYNKTLNPQSAIDTVGAVRVSSVVDSTTVPFISRGGVFSNPEAVRSSTIKANIAAVQVATALENGARLFVEDNTYLDTGQNTVAGSGLTLLLKYDKDDGNTPDGSTYFQLSTLPGNLIASAVGGDGLKPDQNLQDVADVTTARTNLGLEDAQLVVTNLAAAQAIPFSRANSIGVVRRHANDTLGRYAGVFAKQTGDQSAKLVKRSTIVRGAAGAFLSDGTGNLSISTGMALVFEVDVGGLASNTIAYARFENETAVKLYPTITDMREGTNPITSDGTSGLTVHILADPQQAKYIVPIDAKLWGVDGCWERTNELTFDCFDANYKFDITTYNEASPPSDETGFGFLCAMIMMDHLKAKIKCGSGAWYINLHPYIRDTRALISWYFDLEGENELSSVFYFPPNNNIDQLDATPLPITGVAGGIITFAPTVNAVNGTCVAFDEATADLLGVTAFQQYYCSKVVREEPSDDRVRLHADLHTSLLSTTDEPVNPIAIGDTGATNAYRPIYGGGPQVVLSAAGLSYRLSNCSFRALGRGCGASNWFESRNASAQRAREGFIRNVYIGPANKDTDYFDLGHVNIRVPRPMLDNVFVFGPHGSVATANLYKDDADIHGMQAGMYYENTFGAETQSCGVWAGQWGIYSTNRRNPGGEGRTDRDIIIVNTLGGICRSQREHNDGGGEPGMTTDGVHLNTRDVGIMYDNVRDPVCTRIQFYQINGRQFLNASVIAGDIFQFDAEHKLEPGELLVVRDDNFNIGTDAPWLAYYVSVPSSTQVRLHDTRADALSGSNVLSLGAASGPYLISRIFGTTALRTCKDIWGISGSGGRFSLNVHLFDGNPDREFFKFEASWVHPPAITDNDFGDATGKHAINSVNTVRESGNAYSEDQHGEWILIDNNPAFVQSELIKSGDCYSPVWRRKGLGGIGDVIPECGMVLLGTDQSYLNIYSDPTGVSGITFGNADATDGHRIEQSAGATSDLLVKYRADLLMALRMSEVDIFRTLMTRRAIIMIDRTETISMVQSSFPFAGNPTGQVAVTDYSVNRLVIDDPLDLGYLRFITGLPVGWRGELVPGVNSSGAPATFELVNGNGVGRIRTGDGANFSLTGPSQNIEFKVKAGFINEIKSRVTSV